MEVSVEIIPPGQEGTVQAGDFLLCHRKGLSSAIIRWGERIRWGNGHWSHACYCETPKVLIEALAHGVTQNPLSEYRDIEYAIVHTNLNQQDEAQATAFAQSCVGQTYGWFTIAGLILRFLTPGRGLWFGMNGTEICSGLVAQAQVRGWVNYPWNPASATPTDLWNFYTKLAKTTRPPRS